MIAAGTAHALYAQSRRKAVRRQTETQKKKKKKKRERKRKHSREIDRRTGRERIDDYRILYRWWALSLARAWS